MTASCGLFSIQIQITWSTLGGGVVTVPQGPFGALVGVWVTTRRGRTASLLLSEEPTESAVELPRSTSANERIPALTLAVTSSEMTCFDANAPALTPMEPEKTGAFANLSLLSLHEESATSRTPKPTLLADVAVSLRTALVTVPSIDERSNFR